MRKVVFLLIISIVLSSFSFSFADDLNLTGDASVLMDYDTGEILYEKNMDMQLYPASTTKIMTAILAIENGNLQDIVTIDQEVVSLTEGSHIALEPGERLTLEQLLYALLVQSANDSAYAIAKHISGSIDSFILLMNQKAKELGATGTNFVNPNGLHDEKHVSTAHDLALFGQYAMNNEAFRNFVNTVTYTIAPTNKKDEARYLKNTNKLLFSTEKITVDGNTIPIKFESASGVKTGTTSQASHCLVSFAQNDGQRLITTVLKSKGNNVYLDTHKLLNYGFNNFSNEIIGYKNQFIKNVEVKNGVQKYVAGVLDKDLLFPLIPDNINRVEERLVLRGSLTAPISEGDVLGTVEYYLDEKPIGRANVVSTMDLGIDPMTKTTNKILSKWYLFVFALIILLRINVIQKRKKRRSRSSYRMPYGIK